MFKLLFFNRIKSLLKNKSMLFWTLVFPFILGTFFQIALSDVGKMYEMPIIPIAIVDNKYYQDDENLKNVFINLSEDNENKIFNTQYVTEENAKNLLEDNSIDGYVLVQEDKQVKVIVKENGLNQTIIKYVIDEYYQMSSVAEQAIRFNPQNLYNGVLKLLYNEGDFVKDASSEKIDFSINYFFTLIAMTCLYGSMIGLEVIKDSEANLSTKGARICVSPVNKAIITVVGILAGFLVQLFAVGLLFLYLIFVFKVDFGKQILWTIVLSIVGCLAGTTLGTFIGVSNRKSEGFKIGILISTTMLCCFLSGMMGVIDIKVFFDEKLPFFSKINPINIITDGIYALFAYDTLDMYFNCLARISIFSLVLIILTYVFVRRKKYDSI